LIDIDFIKNGSCYQNETQETHSEFFRNGTIIPKNHDRCDDNIGMVEFGGNTTTGIRFYYVYRPWLWANTTLAFETLRIHNKHKMDFIIWNYDGKGGQHWEYKKTSRNVMPSLYQSMFQLNNNKYTEKHDLKELYKDIQKRDIGQYFGADNPWIYDAPDSMHACMPGIPDDKVNFLLWHMLSSLST